MITKFIPWANANGYDTAHTYDTERSRWVFFNPMTIDLWKCWQDCAALVAAHQRELDARVCESEDLLWVDGKPTADAFAAAIRGRGE